MKLNILTFCILLAVLIVSCRSNTKEADVEHAASNDEQHKAAREAEADQPEISTVEIITKLQGEWKEQEYPYRRAHFTNATVKFIEEGVVEEPSFKEYQITDTCPYEVNNINGLRPDDRILAIIPDRRCEKISVTRDILTLSGFNVAADSPYEIIYKKVEKTVLD